MKTRLLKSLALAAVLAALGATAHADATVPSLCVWDPIGAAGPLFDATKNYALAMQKFGVHMKLKSYTDEQVAAEDFRVGQCDGLLATSIRTRPYNSVIPALDYAGATTIVHDGKIDINASYEVVRKAMMVFASPGAEKMNIQDRFEVGGILPTGAVYMIVHDRSLFKKDKGFAGTRMMALDNDKEAAYLIQRAGAQPVACDLKTFVTKFNNGSLDVIFAPAVAYQPLEIFRGMGPNGGMSRFPLAFTSIQLILDRTRFPEGFGLHSRQYWVGQFGAVTAAVRRAEADIPPQVWVDYEPEQAAKYVASQRDLRVEMANNGFYNKVGLKVMKRVRCSVYAAAPECATQAEIQW
jgi:hypothetical protein